MREEKRAMRLDEAKEAELLATDKRIRRLSRILCLGWRRLWVEVNQREDQFRDEINRSKFN